MNYQFPDSVLLIFCKAPVAGQVKTRLQPDLTAEQARDAHIALTDMTLARAFAQSLCAVELDCAPDRQHAFFQQCAADYPLTLRNQSDGDLGQRMHQAFCEAFTRYKHALLIGCDCPSLTNDDLGQALNALQNHNDVVLAPAQDGGYVLIGLNTEQPGLFADMAWGNDQVATETRRRIEKARLKLFELAMQWDVDSIQDWRRFLAKR